MKYSLTISGLVAAVALPLIASLGFSDVCANEVLQIGLTLPGIFIAWIGRVRQGDVNLLGVKQY